MRGLERVTVGAEHAQVHEPVVSSISVDVIELHGDASIRRTLGPSTELAPRFLQPGAEQALLQLVRVGPPIGDEQLVERARGPADGGSSTVPSHAGEVRCVDRQLRDAALHLSVVSTCRHQPERAENARIRARLLHCRAEVFVGPPRRAGGPASLAAKVARVEPQQANPALNSRVRSCVELEPEAPHDICVAARLRYRGGEVRVGPGPAPTKGIPEMRCVQAEYLDSLPHVPMAATRACESE